MATKDEDSEQQRQQQREQQNRDFASAFAACRGAFVDIGKTLAEERKIAKARDQTRDIQVQILLFKCEELHNTLFDERKHRDYQIQSIQSQLPGLVQEFWNSRAELRHAVASISRLSDFTLALPQKLVQALKHVGARGAAPATSGARRPLSEPSEPPEDQHASSAQAGPLALHPCTVMLQLRPELPYAAWRKVRDAVGLRCQAERERRYCLGSSHPAYVAQPLLWTRYANTGRWCWTYSHEQRQLILDVLTTPLCHFLPIDVKKSTRGGRGRRRQDAATSTNECTLESFELWAQRLADTLTPQERAVPWPANAFEWAEGRLTAT